MKNLNKILVLFTLVITCIGVYSFVYNNNEKDGCYCVGVKMKKDGKEISNQYYEVCGAKYKEDAIGIKRKELDKTYKGMGYTYQVYPVADMWCKD